MRTELPRRPGPSRRAALGWLLGATAALATAQRATGAQPQPLFDAHLHYSHDAWEVVPPRQAAALLRAAGLRTALVSSSNDEGTQKLLAEAPDIVVPVLRPYRTRADTGAWVRYCLLYTSPSPRDRQKSRMPSSA